MSASNVYLFCFALGGFWSLITVLSGAGFLSHLHIGHHHAGGGHAGHHHHGGNGNSHGHGSDLSMLHPSGVAVFLAWFGAAGYVLTRHTVLGIIVVFVGSGLLGFVGMLMLAYFLRWLRRAERPMDPASYRAVGILGKISSAIRPEGVGELIFERDGARSSLPARSDDGAAIARGEEVIVTRYEKGVAYVKTWNSLSEEAAREGGADWNAAQEKEEQHG